MKIKEKKRICNYYTFMKKVNQSQLFLFEDLIKNLIIHRITLFPNRLIMKEHTKNKKIILGIAEKFTHNNYVHHSRIIEYCSYFEANF